MRIGGSRGRGAGALAITAVVLLLTAAAGAASGTSSTATPAIFSIAGTGAACSTPPSCGDGKFGTSAPMSFPQGIAVDGAGDVYVADWGDNEVRKISPRGLVTRVAGDGTPCASTPRCGDGGPATSAQLNFPEGVAVDHAGNVYIADSGDNEVRKVSPSGTITTIAGNGSACSSPPSCGDGGPATGAQLNAPGGVAVADRVLYIADTADDEIRAVSSAGGAISTVAGNGTVCSQPPACGDGGTATSAQLNLPQSLAVGPGRTLYVVDGGDNEIRKVSGGTISTIAGDGHLCAVPPACGDGQAATSAELNFPTAVALADGTLYIADWGDNEVRAVSAAGTITAAAGDGNPCAGPPACGDGRAAPSAQLNFPEGLATDRAGNLYVGDTYDNEIRWLPARATKQAQAGGAAFAVLGTSKSHGTVLVRFATSAPATITVSVAPSGHRASFVTRARRPSGFGQFGWGGKLGGKPAPHGRYSLILTFSVGASSASVTVSVRI